MAKEISRKLRDLADKIDNLDDAQADSIIRKDKRFATEFLNILKIVPTSWKGQSNRLLTQLERNNKCMELHRDQKDTIWGWRLSQKAFCNPISSNPSSTESASFPLDSLVEIIEKTNINIVTLSIHWRLSLLLISEVRVHVCPKITDHAKVAEFFRDSGLISGSGYETFSNHSNDWIRGGDSYRAIAQDLGGRGCVIYLPDIGRTNYERYYSLKEPDSSVIRLLATVPDHAKSIWEALTAHEVVDQIVNNAIERIKDQRILVDVSSNTEKTKPKRSRRRGRATRTDDTSARSKRRCTHGPRSTSDQPQDETFPGGHEFPTPVQLCQVNELSAEEAASLLSTIRDGQPSASRTHISHETTNKCGGTDTPIRDTRNAQRSSSESSAGRVNLSSEATNDGCDMMSTEATSDYSMSGETSTWVSSRAAGGDSQFQPVDIGSSIRLANVLRSTYQNPQVISAISAHQDLALRDPEPFGQPIQHSQSYETNQNYAYYAQLPIATTPQLEPANLAQAQALTGDLVDVDTLPYPTINNVCHDTMLDTATERSTERALQDGAQIHFPCDIYSASQGFEEIQFESRRPTDPHSIGAIPLNFQCNTWSTSGSQGFEQVSFESQNGAWLTAPSQGFENISFDENHMVCW